MSFLTVNHKDAANSNMKNNEFPLIDEGKYEAIIKEVEIAKSKAGNDMIKVTVVIRDDVDQKFGKRKLWDYLVDGDKTKWKFQQIAKAIGMSEGAKVATIHDFAKVILFEPISITIKHEDDNYKGDGKKRERIDRYDAPENKRQKPSSNSSEIPF